MRAVSIALVLLSHAIIRGAVNPPPHPPLTFLYFLGQFGSIGVSVFFTISGFLITTLLLNEYRDSGGISLKDFYIRRTLRIWPAFFALLTFVVIARPAILSPGPASEVLYSALFLRNYYLGEGTWTLAHLWSLSVEEQFYFIWPPLLTLARPPLAKRIVAGALLALPAFRVAHYFLFPALRGYVTIMFHCRVDTLLWGVFAALTFSEPRTKHLLKRLFQLRLDIIAAIYLVTVHPLLMALLAGKYLLPIGYSVEAAAAALVMLRMIAAQGTVAYKWLNSRVLVHVGVISYSLYLWQQIALDPKSSWAALAWRLPLCFVLAELSFRFIERPFLRLRARFHKPRPQAV